MVGVTDHVGREEFEEVREEFEELRKGNRELRDELEKKNERIDALKAKLGNEDVGEVEFDLNCPNCGADLDEWEWSDERVKALVHAIAPRLRKRHQNLVERRNEIDQEMERLAEMVDRAEARIDDVEAFERFVKGRGGRNG